MGWWNLLRKLHSRSESSPELRQEQRNNAFRTVFSMPNMNEGDSPRMRKIEDIIRDGNYWELNYYYRTENKKIPLSPFRSIYGTRNAVVEFIASLEPGSSIYYNDGYRFFLAVYCSIPLKSRILLCESLQRLGWDNTCIKQLNYKTRRWMRKNVWNGKTSMEKCMSLIRIMGNRYITLISMLMGEPKVLPANIQSWEELREQLRECPEELEWLNRHMLIKC